VTQRTLADKNINHDNIMRPGSQPGFFFACYFPQGGIVAPTVDPCGCGGCGSGPVEAMSLIEAVPVGTMPADRSIGFSGALGTYPTELAQDETPYGLHRIAYLPGARIHHPT